MNNTELRTLSIGLFILLLLSAACASATTVSIAGATVEPGDVITLPIMIGNITDYGTGTINIEYDPSVAHITNVTSGPTSHIAAHEVNNTLGLARISASNPYGVSGDIIFANVTFEAIGAGSTSLNLDVTLLGDISYNKIPATVSDGSIKVKVSQPPKPFFIYGYVCYENGTPCNSHSVNITNLNTYELWHSETSGGSNYYHSLSSGIDLNATEVLRFDATDGTGSTSVTDHTVTQVEVDAGGFEYNITLESPSSDTVVSIGSTEGSVGDSVDVSINITNASSIGAMDIRVAYNASILYATNVANGSLIESLPAPLVAYHIGYIDVNISFVTFPETIDGDGELFIVTFDLIGGEAGDSSTLEIAAEAYRGSVPVVEVPVTAVNGVITVTGVPDTTPPAITDVANETPTSGSVTITWTTDEASDSLVKYGIDSDNYTDATSDGAMTTSHVIQLSGLTPNTTYYFVVNSTDASGNMNESSEYSFTTMVMTEVGVAIDCATMGSDPSCRTTVNITLNGITDYGAGTIHLYYNESVVNLVAVGLGDSMRVINNSSSGLVKISASNTDGLSGEVVFANVTFKPAGLTHGFSELNLTVETLYGRNYAALQTVISNCSISIGESNLPEVTAPAASPSVILNDTAQMRPRKPGTNITNLTVHVTDDTGVGSVYINLTQILGAGHDMVQMIGPDGQLSGDWYIVTNASYSSLTPYSLNVMAKDYYGNWENGTRITLDVRRRGDVRSSSMAADNKVDSGDYFYIARYTVGLDPAPDDLTSQIVTADSWDGIDMADALYIAMYEAYKPPYGDYEAP